MPGSSQINPAIEAALGMAPLAIPTINELHQKLCERFDWEYQPAKLKQDLKDNARAVCPILAKCLGPLSTIAHGYYIGFNIEAPQEEKHTHCWVNYLGRIYDPTRWRFDGSEPHIFQGESLGENYVYEENFRPKPIFESIPPPNPDAAPQTLSWSPTITLFLQEHIFQDSNRDVRLLSLLEISWLASVPVQYLLPHLIPIFDELLRKGFRKRIPKQSLRYYEACKGEVPKERAG